MEEKRKYERLNAERVDAITILNPGPGRNGNHLVGRLIDISREGLGFEYVVLGDTAEEFLYAGCEVGMMRFSAPFGIAWPRSVMPVYDSLFLTRSFAVLTVRRCGLKWVEPLSESEMESFVSAMQKIGF